MRVSIASASPPAARASRLRPSLVTGRSLHPRIDEPRGRVQQLTEEATHAAQGRAEIAARESRGQAPDRNRGRDAPRRGRAARVRRALEGIEGRRYGAALRA